MLQNASQLKQTMATIIKRSQNTLACVYTTSQFLSNATVKSGSNNIIVELPVSSTRIITNFELFLGGTVKKLKPIKANYGHYYKTISKHISVCVYHESIS